ncbi:MAG: putative extracellular nuclease [Patiriisocius sp.]|jgi:predicted extracellular nuclease
MSSFSGRSIVFYNVENLFDTKNDPRKNDDEFTPKGEKKWTKDRYETKLTRIEDAVNEFDIPPMLIGLVEIENREVLEDLIKEGAFNNIDYGIAHFDSGDKRGIDCALLYDRSAFSIIESSKILVKLDYNRNFVTRDILYVIGEMDDGSIVHVFVNHWPSRREGKSETEHKRMAAAETLREKVDTVLGDNPSANILILGDFNDHPDDKSMEFVLRAKESGYEQDGDLINLLYDDNAEGKGTAVHRDEWAVLDQIIVSQAFYDGRSGIEIQGSDAGIIRRDKLLFKRRDGFEKPNATYGGRKYFGGHSDHLPVYITLK